MELPAGYWYTTLPRHAVECVKNSLTSGQAQSIMPATRIIRQPNYRNIRTRLSQR